MNAWNRALRRLRLLLRQQAVEQELTEEIRLHVELEAEDLVRRGWSPEEARRAARQRFAGIERTRERVREARPLRWLDDLLQDVRYSVRTLAGSPAYAAAAILTLAVSQELSAPRGTSSRCSSASSRSILRHSPRSRPCSAPSRCWRPSFQRAGQHASIHWSP